MRRVQTFLKVRSATPEVFNLRVRVRGRRVVVVFMVDHDSRKRVAKNFRHFFQDFFSKIFKNSSKIPPGDVAEAAATSSSQQPAAAASSNEQPATAASSSHHGHG